MIHIIELSGLIKVVLFDAMIICRFAYLSCNWNTYILELNLRIAIVSTVLGIQVGIFRKHKLEHTLFIKCLVT